MTKIEIFPFCTGYPFTTQWAKTLLKIALSLKIYIFSAKIQDCRQNFRILNFSLLHRIIFYYPLGQNLFKIALCRTVSDILANYSKVVQKIANKVPKWLLLSYLHSYQSQMQYQASYRHNNLVFAILVNYRESISLKCTETNRY